MAVIRICHKSEFVQFVQDASSCLRWALVDAQSYPLDT